MLAMIAKLLMWVKFQQLTFADSRTTKVETSWNEQIDGVQRVNKQQTKKVVQQSCQLL